MPLLVMRIFSHVILVNEISPRENRTLTLVVESVCFYDSASYAAGSITTGMVSLAVQLIE